MPDPLRHTSSADAVRSGLVISVSSICWTGITSAESLVLGAISGSAVLLAFGAVGGFDALGSAALARHFQHARRHDAISADHERLAHRVVAVGLIAVGIGTVVVSTLRLSSRSHTSEPLAGTVVAAISVVVLTYLAFKKRQLGRLIPSDALMADGWLSLAGALTAIAAVAGTGLAAAYDWWWVDPAAAAVVALAAFATGLMQLDPVQRRAESLRYRRAVTRGQGS